MSIFSAPTDSFYKFLAVGGLIIFIAGCILLYQDHVYEKKLWENYWEEEVVLQNEIDIFSSELDYNQKYKSLTDSLNNYYGESIENLQLNDSIAKLIIYNLPDSLQDKFGNLSYKMRKLELHKSNINEKTSWNIGRIMIVIPLFLGEIVGLIGLMLWYVKIQKPLDRKETYEENKKLLNGEIWFGNCQSCCKTFFYNYEFGIEKDGSINKLFCKDCYANGAFVEPELTYKEARRKLEIKLKERKYWFIQRIVMYRKFKKLYRWDRDRIW
ncbi:MAG: hypothetical protein VR77_08435 [Flavobacteriales bacterium BRH_c54]|nr:MAG: hypothetical protein VR77_08435 [Flavobacteriales bacterium BRH_c54]